MLVLVLLTVCVVWLQSFGLCVGGYHLVELATFGDIKGWGGWGYNRYKLHGGRWFQE